MITKKEPNPFIGFYLNWQCSNCGVKYGNEPECVTLVEQQDALFGFPQNINQWYTRKKMKQYTSKDQTAKLIELGFPRPKPSFYQNGATWIQCEGNYSIGELVEFLCPHFQSTNYRLELKKIQALSWDIEVRDVNDDSLDYQVKEELIDALFCACVTLKEEGVI